MKLLNGAELADFIKERQAKQVRGLRQAHDIFPKLAIIKTSDDPVIETYVRLKKEYGEEMLIEVEIFSLQQEQVAEKINELNADENVHGIIVQLPLMDPSQTEELVNMVAPEKDVDGLAQNTKFDAATPMAIMWLLAGYNISLPGKNIVIIGKGRLVGAPLAKLFAASELACEVIDSQTEHPEEIIKEADILISATGVPGLIGPSILKEGAVVIDAGVASEEGKTVGDVSEEVFTRDDLIITPKKGGVGPLTVCALFDNVIRAATNKTSV